jgi:hypothetical protein
MLKMFDHDPSATLEQRDYAHTHTWTLRAPMLALSHPDPALAFPESTVLRPQVFVRNTLGRPVNVSLRFNWRNASSTGKAQGPSLRLAPFETRRIDVAALQASDVLPKDANWSSVILTTDGMPDEVIAVAASYDQTLRYGAQTPFSDQLAFKWVGSPWQYDAQHNSLITAGNGGTKPLQAGFTIFYNQGTQKYELQQTLQPDEQMWIDVGKLIREHVPDKNGNVLPEDLTSGSYQLSDLTNKGVGNVFEGKVIYDKTYGHVTYGCLGCCGYKPPHVWYNPLSIPFQASTPQGVDATDTCSGLVEDVSDTFYGTWKSANTAIATVDYYANHTGVAVGSTSSYGLAYMQMMSTRPVCPNNAQSPGSSDNTVPTITSVSPARGLLGATTKSVTIIGKGFTGGHVNTPAAIQVSNITTFTDTKIVLDLIISSTATKGKNAGAISVSGSNAVDFFVQIPNGLQFVGGSAQNTTEGRCPGVNNCGTLVSFKYQVLDQDSPAQPVHASMSMWDSFASSFSPDNLGLNGSTFYTTCTSAGLTNGGPCGVNTVADGTFTEAALGACCSKCYLNGACVTGGPSDINQTWNIDGYPIVQQVSEYCEKVLVNGTQIK